MDSFQKKNVFLPFAFFEDNQQDVAQGWLLTDCIAVLQAHTATEVTELCEQASTYQQQGHAVALAADYELAEWLEPRITSSTSSTTTPQLSAWVFARQEHLQGAALEARLSQLSSEFPSPCASDALLAGSTSSTAGLSPLIPAISEGEYHRAIERIQQYIVAGDCYQVNFTFPLHGQLYGHPLELYRRLRRRQPVAHAAYLQHADGAILSHSPELFFAQEKISATTCRLTCRPMKGTMARGLTPAQDEQQRQQLAQSRKDQAENLMIVDLLRNDLGRLTPPGGVQVPALFALEAYPSVWQMTSTITAEPVTASLTGILQALFPCGSITGAPKLRAMQIIAELETQPRGIYCGTLGHLHPDGSAHFNVPIRTLQINKQGQVTLGVGSGITLDSDPAAEYAECLLKARFARELPPDFALIETIRVEHGVIPWLDDHLARLRRSYQGLGWTLNAANLRAHCPEAPLSPTTTDAWAVLAQSIRHQTQALGQGTHLLRLQISHDSHIEWRSSPLHAIPEPLLLTFSAQRLRRDHPLAHYKTTRREHYDQALQHAMREGFFDVLFANEYDELCEGARSCVFVELDGEVFTPPLSCGLLDSVARRRWLDGQCPELPPVQERVIRLNELPHATHLWVGNALRGIHALSDAALAQFKIKQKSLA